MHGADPCASPGLPRAAGLRSQFAYGLKKDRGAVIAAVETPWSTSPTTQCRSVIWKVRRIGESLEMPREHKAYVKRPVTASVGFPEEKYAKPEPQESISPESNITAQQSMPKHQTVSSPSSLTN